MRRIVAAVPLAIIVLASGCVSARATMLNPARPYPPVPETEVRIVTSEAQLPKGCERVALIHAEGNADATNQAQMLNAARRRAGKVGANTLLLNEMREPSTGTRIASVVFGTPADRRGQMMALFCAAEGDHELPVDAP
jgi:hypothetical protein